MPITLRLHLHYENHLPLNYILYLHDLVLAGSPPFPECIVAGFRATNAALLVDADLGQFNLDSRSHVRRH